MNARLLIIAIASVAAATVFTGCQEPTDQQPAPTAPKGSVTVTIAPGAPSLGQRAYGANPLAEPVGITVSWYNADSVIHTVKADDGTFDSGPLQPGKVFEFAFTQSGTHVYHCAIHGEAAESGALQIQ